MNWKEIKKAPKEGLGNLKIEMTFQELIDLVNTEIIEKLIEDIPSKFKHLECRDGLDDMCEDCLTALVSASLKQQLRERWLS
jgi:hypothetical protein